MREIPRKIQNKKNMKGYKDKQDGMIIGREHLGTGIYFPNVNLSVRLEIYFLEI